MTGVQTCGGGAELQGLFGYVPSSYLHQELRMRKMLGKMKSTLAIMGH